MAQPLQASIAGHRVIPVHDEGEGVRRAVRQHVQEAEPVHRQPLQGAGLVDEYIVSICPVFIGSGIPLFLGTKRQLPIELTRHRIYKTGVVQLTYVRRRAKKTR